MIGRSAIHGRTSLDAVGVGLVSALAGLLTITRRPLWLDEALDVQWTRLGWWDYVTQIFGSEESQALYLLLLKPWLSVAGHGELAARLPSVLFAALASGLLVPVGTRLLGSRLAGVAAGLLLATNSFSVMWSQQARTYSLSMLAAVALTYAFLRVLDSPGWRWWLAYGVAAGLGVYAHFFVALVVVAHLLALGFAPRAGVGRRAAAATAIAWLLMLPALEFAVNGDFGQIGWIPPLSGDGVTGALRALTGQSVVLLLLTLVGLVLLVVRACRDRSGRWQAVLVASWLVVPIAVCAGLSVFKPLFVDRYLIVVVPAASLCAAYVIARVGQWRGIAVLAVAVAWGSGAVLDWYRSPFQEDWRAASAYVDANRQPGEHLLVLPREHVLVAGYYLSSRPGTHRPTGRVTWVVAGSDGRERAEHALSSAGYTIETRRAFPGVTVLRGVRSR
jgi:mannosyltransferase